MEMKKSALKLEKGYYYHYKHDPKKDLANYSYEVIGIAMDTEDDTYSVIYRPLYEDASLAPAEYYSRPYEMFVGMVEKEGKRVPRFRRITDKKVIGVLEGISGRMDMRE